MLLRLDNKVCPALIPLLLLMAVTDFLGVVEGITALVTMTGDAAAVAGEVEAEDAGEAEIAAVAERSE
jgi:hypothetical protein